MGSTVASCDMKAGTSLIFTPSTNMLHSRERVKEKGLSVCLSLRITIPAMDVWKCPTILQAKTFILPVFMLRLRDLSKHYLRIFCYQHNFEDPLF